MCEKFRGKMMNSRLDFKIRTSSFQTKLFSLCTRALRSNCLHRPFRTTTGDIFHPFHLGRQHPPTQQVHQISITSSPLPRIHSKPSPAPACPTRLFARSSVPIQPPLSFPTRDCPCLTVFVCSPTTLYHIDHVTLASPMVRPGLH